MIAAPLVRRGLRVRRKGIFAWTIGMAVFTVFMLAVYPVVRDDPTFDEMIEQYPEALLALMGGEISLRTGAGFLSAELYTLALPVLISVMTIGAGAALLAGDEEEGRLSLVLATSVRRRSVVVQVAVIVLVVAVIPSVVTGLVVIAGGEMVRLDMPIADIIGIHIAMVAFAVFFGLISLSAGAITGRRGLANGVAATVLVASYLAEVMGAIADWAEPAQAVSPYHHLIASRPAVNGLPVLATVVIVLIGLAASVAATRAFEGRDLVG